MSRSWASMIGLAVDQFLFLQASVAAPEGQLQQLDTQWGIQPSWARKLLVNAQVATKSTFKQAIPHESAREWVWSDSESASRLQRASLALIHFNPVDSSGIKAKIPGHQGVV